MKIRLISLGTKIPNLALMKLSAWHKAQGDIVSLDEPEPDKVYISSPFQSAQGIDRSTLFPNAEIEYGGYGFNLKMLPYEIEHHMPDYSIFDCKISMGFTTRGCIRSCPFCIVPQMEGGIKPWAHPSEFWNQDHNTIMLLDNNWLALPKWFKETSGWILDHDLTIMENGLDIRLLNETNIKRLRELKVKPNYKFAFDNIDMTKTIMAKLKLLEEYGFDLKYEVLFYVYLNSDAEFEDALHRCNILKEQGTNSFVMFNIKEQRTKRVKILQRWANRRWNYWKCDFADYKDSYKLSKKRIKITEGQTTLECDF